MRIVRDDFSKGYDRSGAGYSGVTLSIYGDAIGKLFGQGARAELRSEKVTIENDVPYINILEAGKSMQAPEGIIHDPDNAQYIRSIINGNLGRMFKDKGFIPDQNELRDALLKAVTIIVNWLRHDINDGLNPTPVRTGTAARGWRKNG